MKFLKSHFALSRSQQNGIFLLVTLIIIFQVILFVDFFPDKEITLDEEKIEAYQKQLDSLRQLENRTNRDTIYPFNPNYLTDFKAYRLGLKVDEIDRLFAYRKNGNWVNSKEDFQRVTGISDSLFRKISPSLRFPEWVGKQKTRFPAKENPVPEEVVKTDLNIASASDLRKVNGVGEVLSERIVKYRNSIGGFIDVVQLEDVYGLSPEVIVRINERFTLLSKPNISIKNINEATEAELAEIPYFNQRVAKEILTYKRLHERISSFEELSKIAHFPYDKIDRIKLYLAIE